MMRPNVCMYAFVYLKFRCGVESFTTEDYFGMDIPPLYGSERLASLTCMALRSRILE